MRYAELPLPLQNKIEKLIKTCSCHVYGKDIVIYYSYYMIWYVIYLFIFVVYELFASCQCNWLIVLKKNKTSKLQCCFLVAFEKVAMVGRRGWDRRESDDWLLVGFEMPYDSGFFVVCLEFCARSALGNWNLLFNYTLLRSNRYNLCLRARSLLADRVLLVYL